MGRPINFMELLIETTKEFRIENIHFTSTVEQKGSANLYVGEDIFRFNFDLFGTKRIENMTNIKNELLTGEQLLEKMFATFSEDEKEEKIRVILKNDLLDDLLFKELLNTIIRYTVKQLKNEAEFLLINSFFDSNGCVIHCTVSIFGLKTTFELIKTKDGTECFFGTNREDVEGRKEWFIKEIIKATPDYEKTYYDTLYNWEYSTKEIISRIAVEKFKDSGSYKLSTLYNPELKEMFEQ